MRTASRRRLSAVATAVNNTSREIAMDKNWEEELKRMVDAGIISFTRYATFVDGPYVDQERVVEYYFKRITITAMDPIDPTADKDAPIPVKVGDYELIEGTNGQYKWLGWK